LLILLLWGARADISILAGILGMPSADKALVEETWAARGLSGKDWRKAIHDGVVALPAERSKGARDANLAAVAAAAAALPAAPAPSAAAIEVALTFGTVLDGRLANVPWCVELPDTMTKLCWDNALVVSPGLARELKIDSAVKRNSYTSDVVRITVDGRSIEAPTFVLPGLERNSASIVLGFGRKTGGVATGVGVDAFPLLGADGGRLLTGVKVEKTGKTVELASTQDHFSIPGNPFNEVTFAQMTAEAPGKAERTLGIGGRALVRGGTLKQYKEEGGPSFAQTGGIPENLLTHTGGKHQPSKPLQPHGEVTYDGQQWGMVIDLTACIGCNACAIACQAENNIPSVGRHEVLMGREMHWMRVDRYFSGDIDTPDTWHQPMNCMHCENAPCEPVCPVAATVHDDEGLNGMAYNRCIGTRYCANNCPFKVRRFNYLDFTVTGNVYRDPDKAKRADIYKMQRNPDVTVRYRGVMEKCTYCTQRIEEAKVTIKREGGDRKKLPDGAVTPACAQACPTDAIVFGNINDEKSRVHEAKKSDRNYEMLQELNIRPRTTYLARLRNTNPELG
jgi:Fe-S-cluster-containing dehydrogenase component